MDAKRRRLGATVCLVTMVCQSLGCRTHNEFRFQNPPLPIPMASTAIERPDVELELAQEAVDAGKPFTVTDVEPREQWPLTLRETIQLTLENSEVMRDLGIRLVGSPVAAVTVYDPAIQQVDPRFGVEAALSAFDAQLTTRTLWLRNEQTVNNSIIVGGIPTGRPFTVTQEGANFGAEVSKVTPMGTRFALRNLTDYNGNNVRSNLFPSAYTTTMQAEVRQPLFQGYGLDFNRIAGPNGLPGVYNGVLIARVNTDINLSDFQIAVQNHLRQVEQAYWQLHFAYRNYAALLAGREATLATWKQVLNEQDVGNAAKLEDAAPREQYFQAQAAVQNALTGSPETQTGVYQVERNLRTLMGLPVNDNRLILPVDEPLMAQTVFEWEDILQQALDRRAELRRQSWVVKRRELELIAARNFLLYRVDLVGRYDWNGFGNDLFGNQNVENGSAFRDLYGGDLQGWQMGFQLTRPIGNRIGHAAVRSAELVLARERALHREQQRLIVGQLSEAFAELERSREVSRTNYNRALAARNRLEYTLALYDVGGAMGGNNFSGPMSGTMAGSSRGVLIFDVLNAQQLVVVADSLYAKALVDHTLAASGIHYARGTYLNYLGLELAEGPWTEAGLRSANKEAYRWGPRRLKNYCYMVPAPVTAGPVDQSPEPAGVLPRTEPVEPLPAAPNSSGE